MKQKKSLNGKFLAMADWVSEYMGKPSNIIFWSVAVLSWTLLFALDKNLAHSNFLPAWFTSQAYNFPLNLITTVAELFIGFLVAAAANRAQTALTNLINSMAILLQHIKTGLDNDIKMEQNLTELLAENNRLTQIIHDHVTNETTTK